MLHQLINQAKFHLLGACITQSLQVGITDLLQLFFSHETNGARNFV